MIFTWEGRYVLRRVDDADPQYHRIFKHSGKAGDITDADNYFAMAPMRAEKAAYEAFRVDPRRAWPVTLAGNSTVDMGVFLLRGRT